MDPSILDTLAEVAAQSNSHVNNKVIDGMYGCMDMHMDGCMSVCDHIYMHVCMYRIL